MRIKTMAFVLASIVVTFGFEPAVAQWGASNESIRKCDRGDIAECKLIGQNLESQLNALRPTNSPLVLEIERLQYWALGKACDFGDGDACLMLGEFRAPVGLFGAPRTPENYAGSTAALKRACDTHTIGKACELLAAVLESRRNPQRDEAMAQAYRERAAKLRETKTETKVTAPPIATQTDAIRPANPRIDEHIRKYGELDGLAPAAPDLLQVLLQRRNASGSSVLKEEDIAAIRGQLLADGQIDQKERELVAELTWPAIRAVRIYRAGAADPWEAEGTTFSSVQTRRDELLALLDTHAITWDETDRRATLMKLARASLTQGMEAPVRQLISGKVTEYAPASTEQSQFQPLTTMIIEMAMTAKTLEEDCNTTTEDANAIRSTFVLALDEGLKQSASDFPSARYSWLKPLPSGSRKTACKSATQAAKP